MLTKLYGLTYLLNILNIWLNLKLRPSKDEIESWGACPTWSYAQFQLLFQPTSFYFDLAWTLWCIRTQGYSDPQFPDFFPSSQYSPQLQSSHYIISKVSRRMPIKTNRLSTDQTFTSHSVVCNGEKFPSRAHST